MITGYVRWAGAVVIVAAIAMVSTAPGKAQGRRGGPTDWSHARLMASQFGRDGGRNVARDWRTARKQFLLDRARNTRDPQREWLERFFPRLKPAVQEPTGPHLDWNLRTGGFGNVVGSPAKFNFDLGASDCTDVIYFTVDQAGSSSAVNVIGITNPYAGCSGNTTGATPTVKFGIAMTYGTATSPALSFDGKILYVIESRPSANGGPILHAIQVDNITTSPGVYDFVTTNWTSTHTLSASPIGTASSEQLFQLTYASVANNVASPYVDYQNNEIYFGDSTGKINRVTGINTASAAKYTSGGFPIACGLAQLQSPVFYNNQVITASADGKLYRISTAGAGPYTCVGSVQGGAGTATVGGGMSAPILDVSNGAIISGANNANGGGGRGFGVFDMNFASGANPTSFTYTGAIVTTIAPVPPSFDEAFWSTGTGSLYTAGSNVAGTASYLIRVAYNGSLGAITGNAALTHTSTAAVVATSPVTEFLTGAATNPDYVFIAGSAGTYRYMNRISAGFTGTNTTPSTMAGSFLTTGGIMSGIIVDTNSSNMTGSTALANIYFGTMGVASTTQSSIVQLAQAF